MATADLLLHPVRLRIVEAFLGDRALTTLQLREELPDVPAGSLYRHVAKLVDAGVLSVVGERRVRGAVERTYVLRDGAGYNLAAMWLDDAELAELAGELAIVLQPRMANQPKPGRKRRILATVLLPGEEPRAP
jgi:hypothetical protein